MKRLSLASLALICSGLPVLAQPAPPPYPPGAPPRPALLHLSVHAAIRQAPDIARIGVGVVTQGADAKAALEDNAGRMKAVFDKLKQEGVAEKDMQTSGINLQPQYAYAQNQPPKLTGYRASNTIQVKIRDLSALGRLLDTVTAAGANEISGPAFAIDKTEALLDKAREDAIATAQARATLYAKAAGLRVARLVDVSEDRSGGVMPPPPMLRAAAAAMKVETPVAPGEVSEAVTLAVTYELAP